MELAKEDVPLMLEAQTAYSEETLLSLSRRVPALDAGVYETRGRALLLCARLRREMEKPPETPPSA